MKQLKIIDYRKLRPSNLLTPQFCHLLYLLYWPLYGLLFLGVERLWIRESYFSIHCIVDDMIPFCELFMIPYFFWFVYLIGFILYGLFFDTDSFRRIMRFVIVTYSVAILVYILFPNGQELRPITFERDNILTRWMALFYQFDTNTNVCPSIHVIGSVAVMLAAWNSPHFSTRGWRLAFVISAVLISVSTVFLKQHSILDVLAAIPVCALGWPFVFGDVSLRNRRLAQSAAEEVTT